MFLLLEGYNIQMTLELHQIEIIGTYKIAKLVI